MKAILVIDIPKGCIDCPCHDTELLYCKTTEQHAEYFYEKPSWCPLKPIPQKKWHEEGKENECEEWYRNGWNDCLDAITGETE